MAVWRKRHGRRYRVSREKETRADNMDASVSYVSILLNQLFLLGSIYYLSILLVVGLNCIQSIRAG